MTLSVLLAVINLLAMKVTLDHAHAPAYNVLLDYLNATASVIRHFLLVSEFWCGYRLLPIYSQSAQSNTKRHGHKFDFFKI